MSFPAPPVSPTLDKLGDAIDMLNDRRRTGLVVLTLSAQQSFDDRIRLLLMQFRDCEFGKGPRKRLSRRDPATTLSAENRRTFGSIRKRSTSANEVGMSNTILMTKVESSATQLFHGRPELLRTQWMQALICSNSTTWMKVP